MGSSYLGLALKIASELSSCLLLQVRPTRQCLGNVIEDDDRNKDHQKNKRCLIHAFFHLLLDIAAHDTFHQQHQYQAAIQRKTRDAATRSSCHLGWCDCAVHDLGRLRLTRAAAAERRPGREVEAYCSRVEPHDPCRVGRSRLHVVRRHDGSAAGLRMRA